MVGHGAAGITWPALRTFAAWPRHDPRGGSARCPGGCSPQEDKSALNGRRGAGRSPWRCSRSVAEARFPRYPRRTSSNRVSKKAYRAAEVAERASLSFPRERPARSGTGPRPAGSGRAVTSSAASVGGRVRGDRSLRRRRTCVDRPSAGCHPPPRGSSGRSVHGPATRCTPGRDARSRPATSRRTDRS